jgi:hypothetical protein
VAYPAQIRKLRRIQYFPRLSVSDALRRSAGMATSRPKYSWTFLKPDLEATKATRGLPSKPSRRQESVDRAQRAGVGFESHPTAAAPPLGGLPTSRWSPRTSLTLRPSW